jgi:hypothetical protein
MKEEIKKDMKEEMKIGRNEEKEVKKMGSERAMEEVTKERRNEGMKI